MVESTYVVDQLVSSSIWNILIDDDTYLAWLGTDIYQEVRRPCLPVHTDPFTYYHHFYYFCYTTVLLLQMVMGNNLLAFAWINSYGLWILRGAYCQNMAIITTSKGSPSRGKQAVISYMDIMINISHVLPKNMTGSKLGLGFFIALNNNKIIHRFINSYFLTDFVEKK